MNSALLKRFLVSFDLIKMYFIISVWEFVGNHYQNQKYHNVTTVRTYQNNQGTIVNQDVWFDRSLNYWWLVNLVRRILSNPQNAYRIEHNGNYYYVNSNEWLSRWDGRFIR